MRTVSHLLLKIAAFPDPLRLNQPCFTCSEVVRYRQPVKILSPSYFRVVKNCWSFKSAYTLIMARRPHVLIAIRNITDFPRSIPHELLNWRRGGSYLSIARSTLMHMLALRNASSVSRAIPPRADSIATFVRENRRLEGAGGSRRCNWHSQLFVRLALLCELDRTAAHKCQQRKRRKSPCPYPEVSRT